MLLTPYIPDPPARRYETKLYRVWHYIHEKTVFGREGQMKNNREQMIKFNRKPAIVLFPSIITKVLAGKRMIHLVSNMYRDQLMQESISS